MMFHFVQARSDTRSNKRVLAPANREHMSGRRLMDKARTDFRLGFIKILLDLSQVFVADRRVFQCSGHGCGCESVLLDHDLSRKPLVSCARLRVRGASLSGLFFRLLQWKMSLCAGDWRGTVSAAKRWNVTVSG